MGLFTRGKNNTDNGEEAVAGSVDSFQDAAKRYIAEGGSMERVDVSGTKKYYYPQELRGSAAENGLPFMRFAINQTKGDGKVVVYLYQPPGVSVSDGANYSAFNMGTINGGLSFLQSLYKGTAGLTKADVGAYAMMSRDKLLSPGGGVEKITSAAALSAGLATNPYTRTAFESTNVRSFSFTYKLIAESADESTQIRAIERTFRKFLYPKRAGAVALIYPPLFDISFWAEGDINQYMPNIKPCYLTQFESNFNEASTTMHKGTGAPMEVTLTMGFQEERVLVRQDLYENDTTNDESSGYYELPAAKPAEETKGDA